MAQLIGLPKGMTLEQAYIAGVDDGERKSPLVELAKDLIELDPYTYNPNGGWYCFFCVNDPTGHAKECAFDRIVKYIAELESPQ